MASVNETKSPKVLVIAHARSSSLAWWWSVSFGRSFLRSVKSVNNSDKRNANWPFELNSLAGATKRSLLFNAGKENTHQAGWQVGFMDQQLFKKAFLSLLASAPRTSIDQRVVCQFCRGISLLCAKFTDISFSFLLFFKSIQNATSTPRLSDFTLVQLELKCAD